MYKRNKTSPSPWPLLSEALEYKDMVGMIKPTIHVDEFASKMGEDQDIIVLSFFVRSKLAADDLMNWFEKGYDWIMDADTSPGEIRPGRYLVYLELRRRSSAGKKVSELIDDLATLTEHSPQSWTMIYGDSEQPFNQENFDRTVPLSPREYRARREKDLNEMRTVAGLDTRSLFEPTPEMRQLQSAAGI